MPRIEDIERFTQVLNSLGDEPAIRAARAQTIEEVPPPGDEHPGSGDDGLDTLPTGTESDGTEAQEGLQDFFADIAALPEDTASADALPPLDEDLEGAPGAPSASTDEGLDFASLFGDEAAPQVIEEIGQPKPGRSRTPPPAEAETPADSFPSLDADLSGLQDDLTGMETLPEATAGEMESFDLPSLDDTDFSEPAAEAAPDAEQEIDDNAFAEAAAPSEPETPEELAAPMEASELPSFDLDGASFAEPVPADEPEGAEEVSTEEAPASPAMESLGEESLGDLSLDEFSLPESAEEFGLGGPVAPPPPPRAPEKREKRRPARPAPAPVPVPMAAEEEPAEEGELQLTSEQFVQLKKSLDELPRNLKIAVQDLIGQGTASGASLRQLVDLLLRGGSAQEIATLASKISGKRIRIPAGYEKRSGAAFEAEQRTFRYAFRENILPILRVVLITLIAGGLFGYLGYSYVYRPIAATTNYRVGYGQIANDRYVLANERFTRAVAIWPMKSWFYRYAEAFAAKRQYVLAEEKYDQLLARYSYDKKAILDYAKMESLSLSDYQKADTLLKRILDRSMYDYDALLAAGDNDLEWAAAVPADLAPAKFEAARLAYATLIEKNGAQNTLLFHMLKYFIRVDNGTEVERLRAFYDTRPDIIIDASVWAELGGYLVDHRRLDYAQNVLFRADKVQPGLYEVHYNLARYYRIVLSPSDEKLALDATVKLLSPSDPLTVKRLRIEIDTHTRLGEYYYKMKKYIAAEKDLGIALRLIEQNQKNRLIGKERIFGRAYLAMGDLYYYVQGDLSVAARHYQSAMDNLYTDPELTYKMGYIQYAQGNYKASLLSFADAEEASVYPSGNEVEAPAAANVAASTAAANVAASVVVALPGQIPQNLLFALGNGFYQRGDYFAAQGYYLRLLDRLTTQRALRGTLHPEDTPADREFLDLIAKVNNNIGVTMIKLGDRTGDRKKKSAAMVYLTTAAQIADTLNRNPESVQRSEIRSISSQNLRNALYPVPKNELSLFAQLPKDFTATSW